MGRNGREVAADCTTNAPEARRIPDWLRPYKDQWLTAGKIKTILSADGRPFWPWFEDVRPRLKAVSVLAQNRSGMATKYLVRHVWAAALAHGVRLIPTDATTPAEILRNEIERLRGELAESRLKAQEVRYVNVDRTADSMDIVRLLVASTEPQPQPGVYILLGAAGELLYVGQSRNVLSRMAGHGEKPYMSVRMIRIDDDKRRLEIEGRLIALLQPPLNISGLGFRREPIAQAV